MTCDIPCMSYVALYVISMHIVNSNSRSNSIHSSHWKLNISAGKVEKAASTENNTKSNHKEHRQEAVEENKELQNSETLKPYDEHLLDILTNKKIAGDEWVVFPKGSRSNVRSDCGSSSNPSTTNSDDVDCDGSVDKTESLKADTNKRSKKKKPLSCGKPVNSTQYDHLRGISERRSHSHVPEPDVAMVFRGSNGKSPEVDMNQLEEKLRQAKREIQSNGHLHRERSAQVYNLIGNFWRIKGNTQISIECFRKALSISPNDPDILLNLARVLFNLQYLDDAILLARRSLHLNSPQENSWLQHYTLGEILKSYGHPQEAAMHFNQALQLNPGFQPAKSHLRELEEEPTASVTHLTLFIILFLVVGVVFGVVTSIESSLQELGVVEPKSQQRHFNRAMAMRSIKLGINPRLCRIRKGASNP